MKRRTGCLIKRPSGYYVRIVVEGKVVVRALQNPDGTSVTTIIEARKAQAKALQL
jgi:ribosomal protein L14